ncbi:hypothetical protein BGHDH14_bgh04317 [Blumeria hordei DH14]|uniref:Uncharacterized protein n=1 Tax=Blumeria graminis f. sp. hordei (strain DH14) TaxID=546991 RepID=N1J7V8_BLUG1|nr:hypothetical protein BGHDH14_bgh04317 [Blumeria hordei DH14]
MRCLYAFLLIPREGLENTKRLAIMSDDYIGRYYNVFKPEANENFPVVESSTGIKMTEGEITGPGTYPRAYCSINLSKKLLIQEVTRNLKNADMAAERCLKVLGTLSREEKKDSPKIFASNDGSPEISHSNSNSRHQTSDNAKSRGRYWQRLTGTSSPQPEEPPKILLSKIRETKDCPDLGLISLAYQKKIKATGLGVHFAPEHPITEYGVEFDTEVDINDIVFSGQMFTQIKYQDKFYALAWYMGHLHIFKRNNQNSPWWPETFIGLENRNSFTLVDFIRNRYRVLDPLKNTINEYNKNEINSECCFINCYKGDKEYRQENCRLIAEIRTLKLAKIPEIAEGIRN